MPAERRCRIAAHRSSSTLFGCDGSAKLGAAGTGRGSVFAFGEHGEECLTDLLQLAFVLDLQTEDVFDVEDVDDLLAVGRDLGTGDLQVEAGQRAGDLEEQAR